MTALCADVNTVVTDRTMKFQMPEGAVAVLESLRSSFFWSQAKVMKAQPLPKSMTIVSVVDTSLSTADLQSVHFVEVDDSDLW